IHISEADSSVYAGLRWYSDIPSPVSGMYKSSYRGDSWTHYPFDTGDDHLIIWDIAEDIVDGVLFVGAELSPHSDPWDEPLLRSFDGGVTWERIAPPLHVQILRFEVHPETNDLYYTPESFALFRSSDHGDTYTQLGHRFLLDFLIDPFSTNRIYGGESTFGSWIGGVWASTDTGSTLAPVGLQGTSIGQVRLNGTGSRIYATNIDGFIWVAPVPFPRTLDVWPDGRGLYPTIQAAVDDANPGDTVMLHFGVFAGAGNRDVTVDESVVIRSVSGDPDSVAIDCGGLSRAFHVVGGDAATQFIGLTIRDGLAKGSGTDNQGGAVLLEDGADGPLFSHCVFTNNVAGGHGGAVNGGSQGTPVFEHCRFESNQSGSWGGAFSGGYGTASCSPTFTSCVFEGNQALDGGGGGLYLAMNSLGTAHLDSCVFRSNAALMGGAAFISDGALTISQSTCAADTAGTGSELYLNLGTPVIENTIVAFGSGGRGVHCQGGAAPVLSGCDVYGNQGGDWIACLYGQESVNDNFSLDPLFCDLAAGDLTLQFVSSPCLPENNGAGLLVGALGAGCQLSAAVDPGIATGSPPMSLEVYPNPFNPRTTIRYTASVEGPVEIAVYDLAGRLIRTLVDGEEHSGRRSAVWDGRDEDGRAVAGGIYLCRLNSADGIFSRKLVLLR
ncbi:MAG: right-handed parallel beta-helix repeat-containing protein, partial [Verrucomicrobiota bacterium]